MAEKKNGHGGRHITLSDGREIALNLSHLTWADVKAAQRLPRFDEKNEVFLSGIAGLTVDEWRQLEWADAWQLETAVWEFVQNPLKADPN